MATILREIGMIARCLDSISNIEFRDIALTKCQYLYVVRVYEHPGIIPDKVADMLKVDRTTAARAIQKLEEQGFLEKRNDETNRKIKRLYVTKKGAAVYPTLAQEEAHSHDVAVNGMSEEDVAQLQQLLERMRRNVEVDWEKVKRGEKRSY